MRQEGPRRVAIVESDIRVARSLELLFRRDNCECKVMASGEEAIALADEWVPDAVVMELLLRGATGLETAPILQAKCPECLIVLIYAQVADWFLEQAEERGFLVLKNRCLHGHCWWLPESSKTTGPRLTT